MIYKWTLNLIPYFVGKQSGEEDIWT